MKTSIVYPNSNESDIALGFNNPKDYSFVFKEKDKKT
jgi:hypothetical protein